MLKTLLLTTALFLAPMAASAQTMSTPAEMPAGAYTLDPTHASVTWKVSHMGLSNYTARFTKINATINYDPADITKSTVVATVEPGSVRTDYPNAATKDFDAELANGKDWFNSSLFPTATFKSTKIVKTGEKTGDIYGDLTFLGVTKPLVLHATFNGAYLKKPMLEAPGMGFSAVATLKRSDWGFNTYIPMLGDDVTLLIETEFNKAK